MTTKLVMQADEVMAYMQAVFPQSNQYGFNVKALSDGRICVGMNINDEHLRPGGTISGPTMFALADCAAYLIVLAHIGKVSLAVTTSLNINFLAKPGPGNLVADANLLKLGKRLAVCDVKIHSEKSDIIVAQASVTYSIPPNRRAD